MEERVKRFADGVWNGEFEENKKYKNRAIFYFVFTLISVFFIMAFTNLVDMLTSFDVSRYFDGETLFDDVNAYDIGLRCLLITFLSVYFTYSFYSAHFKLAYKVSDIQKKKAKNMEIGWSSDVDMVQLFKMHNIPLKPYFKCVSKRIRPYRIAIIVTMVISSLISGSIADCLIVSLISVAAMYLTCFFYEKYYMHRVQLDNKVTIGDFIVAFISAGSTILAIMICTATGFIIAMDIYGLIEQIGRPMADSDIIQRTTSCWLNIVAVILYVFSSLMILTIFELQTGYHQNEMKVLRRVFEGIVAVCLLTIVITNIFWSEEINYTDKTITTYRFAKTTVYDFDDIVYEWIDLDDGNITDESYVELTLPSGIVLNTMEDTQNQGDYESEIPKAFPLK